MKKLILLVSIVLFSACTNDTGHIQENTIRTLMPIDSLEIHIDASTPTFPGYIDYTSEYNLLLVGNEFNSSIQFYDLKTRQITRELTFDKEGPNGIRNMGAITYINNDSILIFDRPAFFKISDGEGNIIFSGLPKTNYNLMSGSATRSYIHFNQIISYNRGTFTLNTNNYKAEAGNSIAVSFNLSDSSTNDWLKYPSSILNNRWDSQQLWFYTTQNKNEKLVSFANAGSDSITSFYDADFNYKTQFFGSRLFPKPSPYSFGKSGQLSAAEAAEMKNWFITKGTSYGPIHYDKFRNLYYRFINLPNPNATSISEKPKGLLVANADFSVIKEFSFDGKINMLLHSGSVIITEDGLYIYVNNEIEDTWKWYLFIIP